MGHHIIELDCICTDCNGTGLYRGFAEGKEFGVVCYECKGTGKAHIKFEYDDFKGKVKRTEVKQVIAVNPGIGVAVSNGYTLDSFGGMRYEDWFKGKPFPPKSEMRQFVCPAWWYQAADYDLKPGWCREYGFSLGSFSSCPRFPKKELCWERFDSEHS